MSQGVGSPGERPGRSQLDACRLKPLCEALDHWAHHVVPDARILVEELEQGSPIDLEQASVLRSASRSGEDIRRDERRDTKHLAHREILPRLRASSCPMVKDRSTLPVVSRQRASAGCPSLKRTAFRAKTSSAEIMAMARSWPSPSGPRHRCGCHRTARVARSRASTPGRLCWPAADRKPWQSQSRRARSWHRAGVLGWEVRGHGG